MSELRDLYQEVIIDHSKRPHNFKVMDGASRRAIGNNPLCGDQLTLYLKMEGDRVVEASFQGSGCAISTASASMMTDAVRGKSSAEIEVLFQKFHALVMASPDQAQSEAQERMAAELGKLAVFSGVCEFPARVKCASLAWHTLHNAISGQGEAVASTEEGSDNPNG